MQVARTNIVIKPDAKRVLLRPFDLGDEQRVAKVVRRVTALDDQQVKGELENILAGFDGRHRNVEERFRQRFEGITRLARVDDNLIEGHKLLIGAYFCSEYSVEAAALFNPSMVWHPDQSGVLQGSKRFVLTLRATGEGHISSIEFRTGVVSEDGHISMDQPNGFVSAPVTVASAGKEAENEMAFLQSSQLAERVIFPVLELERKGIEDARFVQFRNGVRQPTYYATYTAYDGHNINSRLLQTDDFVNFRVVTLQGQEVRNKGMALFPRKVGKRYAMISRQDNENLFIMFSDEVTRWDEKQLLLEPAYPWEFVQIGNCGSPMETEAGWLLLTHGVGPMRQYAMGAVLLDLENPTRVVGRLKCPLLRPDESEREGYVPNVVYSCGSQIHNGKLIIPYAMSDVASSFAMVDLDDLLSELTSSG